MQAPDALSMSPLDTVSSLATSTCKTVMSYYSALGKTISTLTSPHLPPTAQIVVEALYNNAPAMVPALVCPNFVGKCVIPGAASAIGRRKVTQTLGPEVTKALYDAVFKAVLFNAVCDAVNGRGYWVSLDAAFAAVLYFQKG